MEKPVKTDVSQTQKQLSEQEEFTDYPFYPKSEEIYSTIEKIPLEEGEVVRNAEGIDPDTLKERTDFSGEDSDFRESELDDANEEIDKEDEEK